jgi:hypothetical protein
MVKKSIELDFREKRYRGIIATNTLPHGKYASHQKCIAGTFD